MTTRSGRRLADPAKAVATASGRQSSVAVEHMDALHTRGVRQQLIGWMILAGAATAFFAFDAFLVTTGLLDTVERRWWFTAATDIGPQWFRVLEAITLVGISNDSSRDWMIGALVTCVVVAMVLYGRGWRLEGFMLTLAVGGAGILVLLLRSLITRAGPSLTPWTPAGHTFPSGTAAVAVAFFLSLGAVVHRRFSGPLRIEAVVGLATACGATVASAATYHYPTEIAGGVALAIAWTALLQAALLWIKAHGEVAGRLVS